MILCDIGNTTFSFYDTKSSTNTKVLIDDLSKINIKKKKKIHFISVNSEATKLLKQRFKDSINLENNLIFNTKYQGMGIDRKVLCAYINDGIVIDAGSAITIDVMSDNVHLGGTILLGLQSIKSAYPMISDKLLFDFELYTKETLPQNTNEAINYAIKSMIIEPIKSIINNHQNKTIYITGGDGEMIYKILEKEFQDIQYNQNLIFDAMRRLKK